MRTVTSLCLAAALVCFAGCDNDKKDDKTSANKGKQGKKAETKLGDTSKTKTGDNKTGDNKTGDNKTGDNKTGDNKTGDNKTGDNKTGDPTPGGDKTSTAPGGDNAIVNKAVTTMRALCTKATACKCNKWGTVDGCITGFTGGKKMPGEVVSCIGALSCHDLCKTAKPNQCVQTWFAKASKAARDMHKLNMKIIKGWPTGDTAKCPDGYKWTGTKCVVKP